MNSNSFHIRLQRVREILLRMDSYIVSLETMDARRFPEKYETLSTEAGLLSEKAACIMRQILYDTGTVNKIDYLEKAAIAQGITVSFGDGILEIVLPCLLPKKRGKNSGSYVFDPLNAALEQFKKTLPIPRFRECSVCVVHVFNPEQSARPFFDYDNLQQKQLLDMIATHAMVDDNNLLCDVHHTAEPGEADKTKVFVMSKERFPKWLAQR